MAAQIRKPDVGDLAGILGHQGVFTVCKVHDNKRTADLRLTTGEGAEVLGVPWTALYYKREHIEKT